MAVHGVRYASWSGYKFRPEYSCARTWASSSRNPHPLGRGGCQVTRKEFYQIGENILNQVGCGPVLNCTQCTSGAISGVGVFKNIPSGIFRSASLKKEMDKISKPLKIIRRN